MTNLSQLAPPFLGPFCRAQESGRNQNGHSNEKEKEGFEALRFLVQSRRVRDVAEGDWEMKAARVEVGEEGGRIDLGVVFLVFWSSTAMQKAVEATASSLCCRTLYISTYLGIHQHSEQLEHVVVPIGPCGSVPTTLSIPRVPLLVDVLVLLVLLVLLVGSGYLCIDILSNQFKSLNTFLVPFPPCSGPEKAPNMPPDLGPMICMLAESLFCSPALRAVPDGPVVAWRDGAALPRSQAAGKVACLSKEP